MKKKLIFLMGILLMVFSSMANPVLAAQEESVGKIYNITVSYADFEEFPQEVTETFEENGYVVEDGVAHRVSLVTEGTIFVDGVEKEINENGTFEVPQDKNEIEISFGEDQEGEIIQKNAEGNFEMNSVVNLEALLQAMELHENMSEGEMVDDHKGHHNHEKHDGTSSDEASNGEIGTMDYGDHDFGDWVHCNRFNGPASDGGHYPKTHWRAYANFVGSDCDLALLQSTKCYGHGYCNQSGPAAGCSTIIDHNRFYHPH